MKLLFDNNISRKIIATLVDDFPGSKHVGDVGLQSKSDLIIWDFARKENFVIVTKDSDFVDMAVMYGHPPKCIWLALGNCSTEDIRQILSNQKAEIKDFLQDESNQTLVLGNIL